MPDSPGAQAAPATPPAPTGGDAAALRAAEATLAPAATSTEAPAADGGQQQESALVRDLRKRERQLIERQNQQTLREQQAAANMQATIDAAVAKAIAERDAKIKGDPVAQLQALGFTDQEIAQRLLNKGKPSAEEIAQRAADDAKKLREELAQRDRAAASKASEDAFHSETENGVYENLALEWPTKAERLGAARAALQEYAANGNDPNKITYKQLAKYLDKLAKYRTDQREKAKAEKTKKAASQDATKAETKGSPGLGSDKGQSATTTLGNGLPGSETVSPIGKKGRPPTDAEIIAHVEQQAKMGLLNGRAGH